MISALWLPVVGFAGMVIGWFISNLLVAGKIADLRWEIMMLKKRWKQDS